MDATKQILDAVHKGKTKLTKEKNAFETAMQLVGIKTDSEIDLMSGRAVSQVADIVASVRKASDRLYTACQMQVKLLDAQCRPLLSQEVSTCAVKEVTALIQKLNKESEIGTNFRGKLNGGALRDLLNVQYIPSIDNKMIQTFWEEKYASMPGTAEEDKAYKKREKEEIKTKEDLLRQAKLEIMREEREAREQKRIAAAQEKADRLQRIAENAEQTRQRRDYLKRARDMLGNSRRAFAYVKADGTVGTVQDRDHSPYGDVSSFRGIRAVTCGTDGIVGLRYDGTCRVARLTANDSSQIQNVAQWRSIEALAVGEFHTVGLRKDGTCVATPFKSNPVLNRGQCNVAGWTNVKAIACGDDFTVGLRADGTVLYTGAEIWNRENAISGLTDIEMITAGGNSVLALSKTGVLHFYGTHASGPVAKAENVVQLALVDGYPYVLQADGTLLGGRNDPFHPEKPVVVDRNVLAIAGNIGSGSNLRYLKEDGTVMTIHCFETRPKPLMEEKLFSSYEQYLNDVQKAEEARQARIRQITAWREAGVCQYCGGSFKSVLFAKKCTACGRKKDY